MENKNITCTSAESLAKSATETMQEHKVLNTDVGCDEDSKYNDSVIGTQGELAKPNNSSLSALLIYSSDSSDDDSDSCVCDSDSTELNEVQCSGPAEPKKKEGAFASTMKGMRELTIDELPPVPDVAGLNLNIKAEECDEIGKIASVVDKLVMVQSIPDKPVYDLDTLLFLDNGRQPLGYIYDVIGPVTCPMYAVRFNSTQEIASLNITCGLPVFSAPKSQHSQYVFVQKLLQSRGTDASWLDDTEVPAEEQDYSDDEVELSNKKLSANRKRNSIDRHQNFEKDMNVKNLIDSRLHKIRDNYEPTVKKQVQNNNQRRAFPMAPNFRPNFAFSQPNTSSTSCAFGAPPLTLGSFMGPPYMRTMPMPPFNTPFVPNLPPANFSMPPPRRPPFQMQQSPYQDMMNVFPSSTAQPKAPVYPPNMGLPRPPVSQNPNFVPNVNYFDPRVHMWHGINNPPPTLRQQCPPRGIRILFPKQQ